MVKVERRHGESDQQLLRRFRKAVSRSGVLGEVRKRRWFMSKSEKRRLARKKAIHKKKKNMRKKAIRKRR